MVGDEPPLVKKRDKAFSVSQVDDHLNPLKRIVVYGLNGFLFLCW